MNKGFTLIELLVVVLIIGILSAIALPQYTTAVEKARSAEAVSLMASLRYAAERYRMQSTGFPNTDMSVLDIEVPSDTKNFTITTKNITNGYLITAERKTGSKYKLYTAVAPNGQAKRYCASGEPSITTGTGGTYGFTAPTAYTAGTDAAKMCNAITSGKPTNGEW